LERNQVQGGRQILNYTIALDNWLSLEPLNNTNTELICIREFHGQRVLISNDTIFIHIKELFYSAGKKYVRHLKNSVGIGLTQELVDFADFNGLSIGVIIGTKTDRYYQCIPIEVQKFAYRKKSIDKCAGVTLLKYPWSLCKTIKYNVATIVELLRGGN